MWKRTFSPRWPIWCFMYAYINRYSCFLICLKGPQWSAAHGFPSHDDKCCKVTCFVLNHLYCFSKALKVRMCTAIEYCSDVVNSVSVALQSDGTEHRILSSLPFIQRQSNEVQIVLLFFGTFVIFVAVHWWCFFFLQRSRNHFLWEKEITLRYVPYTYLPVGKERDHCQSSIVNYEKIKIKCLVRPEKR